VRWITLTKILKLLILQNLLGTGIFENKETVRDSPRKSNPPETDPTPCAGREFSIGYTVIKSSRSEPAERRIKHLEKAAERLHWRVAASSSMPDDILGESRRKPVSRAPLHVGMHCKNVWTGGVLTRLYAVGSWWPKRPIGERCSPRAGAPK